MKTAYKVVQDAMQMLKDASKYAYLYGIKGSIITEGTIDGTVAYYPDHFKGMDIEAIKKFSIGKIGYDCSGLVAEITGLEGSTYQQIAKCTHITTNLKENPEGSYLWKQGHCGLDIGHGFFIHIPIEGRSVEIGRISEYNWEKSGRIPTVEYGTPFADFGNARL